MAETTETRAAGSLRIGIFMGELDLSFVGGLATYSAGVIQGLAKLPGSHRVIIFAPAAVEKVLKGRLGGLPKIDFVAMKNPALERADVISYVPGLGGLYAPLRNLIWRRQRARMSALADVVYFPTSYLTTPALDVPTVASFHDLQHEFLPENFGWPRRRVRRVRFGATFRYATAIQASSQAMKDDALSIYRDRIKPDAITVIPEGADSEAFGAPAPADARAKYKLPAEFLFYPAQLWPHKNHLRLLQALKLLRDEGLTIPLVLTGGEFSAAQAIFAYIREAGLEDQVWRLGKVPFDDLRSLYQQATYLIAATLYESSSLPLVEGAASGVALIASATPPNKEASAWFQLRLFDPYAVPEIARVLKEAWKHRTGNVAAVAANRKAAKRFDWEHIAAAYLALFEKLVAQRPK